MRISTLVTVTAIAALAAACGSNSSAIEPTGAPSVTAPTTPTAAVVASPTPEASKPAATSRPSTAPAWEPTDGPLELAWSGSGPIADTTSTVGSAVDPTTGNLWVAVPFENRYWIFSPKGKYLESWGKGGSARGELDLSDHRPNPDGWGGIAFAPDGSFFIADTGNHRVQHFDKKRVAKNGWGSFGTDDGQFTQLISIATDGMTVYAGDGSQTNIQAFTADGDFIREFDAEGGFYRVALGSDGRLRATNGERETGAPLTFAIFQPDGTEVARTQIEVPAAMAAGIAVDDAGHAYISLLKDAAGVPGAGIVEFDADGTRVHFYEGDGDALTVAPDGSGLFVSRGVQLDGTQWTDVRKYALP